MFKYFYSADGLFHIGRQPAGIVEMYSNADATSYPTNFKDLLEHANESGVYKMWSSIQEKPIKVYVHIDEPTSQKWVLILRYNHKGGTNPNLRPIMQGDFPLPGTSILDEFKDEQNSPAWGHVRPEYLSEFKVSEVAFYGATNAHGRIINFTTAMPSVINMLTTGKGGFRSGRCFCTEPNALFGTKESAILPAEAEQYSDNGDVTNAPFFVPNVAFWNIRGDGFRWEVDNMLYSGGAQEAAYAHDTLHMIFVR